MNAVRVRTIMPKSGPMIEISTSDKKGMVRIQVVEEADTSRRVHVIEAFFGSLLGELNVGPSATPAMGLPLGRAAKILKERGWAVVGSPNGEEHAVLMFAVENDKPISCDLPIIAMCRLVEHVATGAHHDVGMGNAETVTSA